MRAELKILDDPKLSDLDKRLRIEMLPLRRDEIQEVLKGFTDIDKKVADIIARLKIADKPHLLDAAALRDELQALRDSGASVADIEKIRKLRLEEINARRNALLQAGEKRMAGARLNAEQLLATMQARGNEELLKRLELERTLTTLRESGVSEALLAQIRETGLRNINLDLAKKQSDEDKERSRKLKEITDQLTNQANAQRDFLRSIDREVQLNSATTDQRREQLRLMHRLEDLRDRGLTLGIDTTRLDSRLFDLEKSVRDRMAASGPSIGQDFIESLQFTVSSGLSDVIVDGITNGFENASDIAKQAMDALLRSLINQIVSSGITKLMASIFGGGRSSGGGIAGSLLGVFSGGLPGGTVGPIFGPQDVATGSPDGITAVPTCGPGG